MSTATIFISGVCKWAKVYQKQMDTRFGEGVPNVGKFSIVLYPDEEGLVLLKTAGSRVKKYDDEDGTNFKLSRDNTKVFKDVEEILGPPRVIDKDGNPFTEIIGNGSRVTVKLDVYDSKFGKGTRLEAVRVDEHIPYETTGAEELF